MPLRPGSDIAPGFNDSMSSGRERLNRSPPHAIRYDVVRAASKRIIDRWDAEASDAVSLEDLKAELNQLTDVIEQGAPDTDAAATDPATLIFRSRLLQELRRETVQEWSANGVGDAQAMLEVLQGFEQAQAMLESREESDDLARRLSDPGGLGLLIEVAHDLRSPLTSVLFLAETLLRGQSGGLNEVQRRQLGIIYSAGLALISTASDVIEMARSGEWLDFSDPVAFSLTALMEPVRDIVQPMADEKGVSVRIVPAAPDQRLGYPVPLSRVLLNLTTNALKFTNEGFVEVTARATSPTRIEFSVADTGSGIEPEALRTLFQPFRRRGGNRSGYYFSGTGLGLTICRKLVRAMGGELQLETRTDWGTRFFFEIEAPPVQRM